MTAEETVCLLDALVTEHNYHDVSPDEKRTERGYVTCRVLILTASPPAVSRLRQEMKSVRLICEPN